MNHFRLARLLFVVLALLAASFFYISLYETEKEGLVVSFLDIGQGDAIYIQAPNGRQVLVDGSPGNILLQELGKVLPFYDRSIDIFVITNPDKDHVGGFPRALKKFKVDYVLEPGTLQDSETYENLQGLIAKEGAERIVARKGDRIVLDEESGVYIDILYPDRDVSLLPSNDGSIVSKLVYASTSVMLQGDATALVENSLLYTQKQNLDADILKVGHHGSRTSTLDLYVKAVSPDYAVISLGEGNSYGHPHEEVLQTLSKNNVPVLRTDINGRITFVSDGNVWTKK